MIVEKVYNSEYPKWYRSDNEQITLWVDHNSKTGETKTTAAWVDNGSKAWKLTPEEASLPPEQILTLIEKEYQNGKFYRCSDCGTLLAKNKIAGHPLFAGVNCAPCWKKSKERAKQEQKSGAVCSFCHRPYSECCC